MRKTLAIPAKAGTTNMLLLRSIFFTLLLPGTVTIVVPYFILSPRSGIIATGSHLLCWLGVVPIIMGAAVLLRCIWDFAVAGRGTLAPVDPPRCLVVRGLYRYVRNPMYVGVLCVLLGEALLFASPPMWIYAAGFFAAAHLFVMLYEEPTLRRRFGASYEKYARTVHRWAPRKANASG